jgi:O-succinylbenzoic acid--CoA ligase
VEDWLSAQRSAHPDGVALTFHGQTWNYANLDDEVNLCCKKLCSLGLELGDILAVHLVNSARYVVLVHAAARLGLVLAPINTRLTHREITWQLERLNARFVISDRLDPSELTQNASPCQVISVAGLWELPEQDYSPLPLDLARLQAVIFTSGTTGTPKGVQVTFAQHFWSALGSSFRLGLHPQDRWLSVLPLYHVGGLAVLYRSCLYGTAVSLQAGFDLDLIARALQQEHITMISLVPTMLQRMLSQGVAFPDSLRLILLGGAAAPKELLEACAQLNLPIAITYGLTETASQVATLPPEAVRLKPGSVGKPLLWNRVQILDDSENILPANAVGEVCVSGPVVMPGYWQDEPATQAVLRGGWLHSGDLGYLDDDGDLWVVQRRTDLIVSGGENVYPAEVEAVLRQHSAVMDVCVVGIPDAEWGQRVVAVVVVKDQLSVTEASLIAFARLSLAGYKIPREVHFVKELPMTASGKVSRQAVTGLFFQRSEHPGESDAP